MIVLLELFSTYKVVLRMVYNTVKAMREIVGRMKSLKWWCIELTNVWWLIALTI